MNKLILALSAALLTLPAIATPRIVTSSHATPREQYAATRLREAVANLPTNETILLAQRHDALIAPYDKQIPDFWPNAEESFILRRLGNTIIVTGYDASGTLYGALELTNRIAQAHAIPSQLDYEDHPQLKLRGTAIGMQKPEITYEGAEYDYPYTPKDFPFFYDKAWWTHYLDYLVDNRYNALFLWNGHPFTSLLKLPKYPEAQELPTAQLDQNIAMFRWLTAEADKRGIWILQGFYNIHLSHAFARAHHLPYHLSAPTPLSSDYTRYCIAQFIQQYPHVGIFMTLGEAMGPHYGPQWLAQTIIPGVKDGLAALSQREGQAIPEPPIIVRAHATDIQDALAAAHPLYSNIDTMWKWNGESLTWTNIRGPVRSRFADLVAGSNVTIANIHLLSNLEPFRWGDPDFIRETEHNFIRIGIGGLHLYPLRYWDWPYSADNTTPLLQQTDRDWIWYEAWARYAWNPERNPQTERTYWITRFADRFTSTNNQQPTTNNQQAAEHLLNAYELSGICAPKLLPRIGITEGNREVFSLGMTMPQLIDAARFNPAETLWTGDAPAGERLTDYVANEVAHKPHHGETPIGVAAEVAASSAKAVEEAEAAAPGITRNQAEYNRIVNDTKSIAALMAFYNAKVQAAALVMQYSYDHNLTDLEHAEPLLAESVSHFKELVALTDTTYRDAAAMHTSQRQIPVRGGPDTEHFRDVLPVYEKELATFQTRLKALETATNPGAPGLASETREGSATNPSAPPAKPLPEVPFTLAPGAGEAFTIAPGQPLYTDDARATIATVVPELNGLKGIRVSTRQEIPLHFTLAAPAQILVGFFKSSSHKALDVSPATEQWNLVMPDAVIPSGGKALPISVWAKPLPAGRNDLDLGKGAYIVLGFVPADTHIPFTATNSNNLDWLFEN
ncbi:hypothetical protein GCM10011507_01810 [Edaphobacter acidisoli]|uniref:Beta-hexosaminidase bacterial type N-terminal domain-containing protein n=2 Tax=Edaphobacter acidisoli TaxID=2040573 RepID=A0A916RHR2_9BACT|nr:hypothetical protein GCM10011507_01810 [Edaphobacter acidisoli]